MGADETTLDNPARRSFVCPAFIGRGPIMAALRGAVSATSGGAGQTVLISGEAGIGKSRLVRELRRDAAACGLLVLDGTCFPQDRTAPYAPLLEMLRKRFAGEPPDVIAAIAGPFARELSVLLPDLIPVPADPSAPVCDPDQERW